MSIQEQVDADWKAAMKARSPDKDALSSIRTELKNKAIETRPSGDQSTTLSDDLATEVLNKMAKQRAESIAEFKKGGRDDLVATEEGELKVIEQYLPKALDEDTLRAIIKEVIDQVGATSAKEMGKVMGPAMGKAKAAGRVDGKVVQALVKEMLA